MRAEVPVALLPAHRGRVERREERGRRLGRWHRLEVAVEHVAGRSAEIDLRVRHGGEGGARLPQRPTGPPADVRLGGGAEGGEPAAQQLDLRGGDVELLDRPAEPVLGRDPAELGADPRPSRPAADEAPLHRHLREHARSRALLDLPPPGAEAQLLREQRDVPGDLGGHGGAARGHGRDGGVARTRDPGARPGRDSAVAHEALEAPALRRRDRLRRRGEDDRQQLARHGPQRPPHREQADEAAVVVQRAFDVGRRDAIASRLDREVHRDRIGRVQADERARDLERIVGTRRGVEAVTDEEPRPPLVGRDHMHGRLLSAELDFDTDGIKIPTV